MRTTKQLLSLLTEAFPPFPGASHAMCVQEGKLTIALALGPSDWKLLSFDDEDLERPAEDLFTDISDVMAAVEFDRKKAEG